ncbi:hypothetical protein SKAU_G00228830 [Synaphobranchus kaupii]|uniref:Uncharacterized protein n=1 Tax=Synaphobranchus kaupii TaxID=118154 RepID=A0A9Q1F565_SYNKA|nr:hypothetical protein SKAU_G00228830 [Synaphobranchus kaupii]
MFRAGAPPPFTTRRPPLCPPEPASPTSSAPPKIHALPPTPPSAPSTATGSTPSPQADCLARHHRGEQAVNAASLHTPVRERFYYYRSPSEPRAGSSTERTWRPGHRQSWHCGQLPPSTDARR